MPFINFNAIPHRRIWNGIHGALYHSDHLTMGHVTVENGAILPEHHHINEQWTHVIEGELEFTIDGETHVLKAGETAHILPDVPHSAKALTRVRLIDCFMPVREDFKTLEPWTEN
jgi:quercetin dioxygenase-like cupin family protein